MRTTGRNVALSPRGTHPARGLLINTVPSVSGIDLRARTDINPRDHE